MICDRLRCATFASLAGTVKIAYRKENGCVRNSSAGGAAFLTDESRVSSFLKFEEFGSEADSVALSRVLRFSNFVVRIFE
jgi:hypothetical protein